MPTLHVALQEGFDRDPVVVRVGGVEVFRHAAVTTRPQIGLAASFSTSVAPGDVELDLLLPNRSPAEQQWRAAVRADAFVGVSLDMAGRAAFHLSDTPFHYV